MCTNRYKAYQDVVVVHSTETARIMHDIAFSLQMGLKETIGVMRAGTKNSRIEAAV